MGPQSAPGAAAVAQRESGGRCASVTATIHLNSLLNMGLRVQLGAMRQLGSKFEVGWMQPMNTLSIVIPVRNECESIPPLLQKFIGAERDFPRPYRIIVVDGVSTDGTREAVR